MTRPFAEQIVKRWIEVLGLGLWDIHVVWPEDYSKWPENEGNDWITWKSFDHAKVWRAKDYNNARLYLNEKFLTNNHPNAARTLEVCIVHELLHLVTRDVESILDHLDGLLHRDVQDVIEATFMRSLEGAIDNLAYRLVDLHSYKT